MRSPSSAPCEKGLDGSTDTTPTSVPSSLSLRGFLLRVDESNQAGDLLVGAIERWHAFLRAPVANHRSDLVAINIRSHQF